MRLCTKTFLKRNLVNLYNLKMGLSIFLTRLFLVCFSYVTNALGCACL